jgi:hypothetical protein
MIAGIIAMFVIVLIWIWIGSKIFWKEGFKELDNVLGKKVINFKKEENDKVQK